MNKKIEKAVGVILLFVTGLGGMAGGMGLMLDPPGTSLGMSVELLPDSPFADFFYPGLLLFAVIGAGHFFGGFVSVLNPRIAAGSCLICGTALVIWIVVQIWMIGLVSFLQPLFLLIGLTEAIAGVRLIKAEKEMV